MNCRLRWNMNWDQLDINPRIVTAVKRGDSLANLLSWLKQSSNRCVHRIIKNIAIWSASNQKIDTSIEWAFCYFVIIGYVVRSVSNLTSIVLLTVWFICWLKLLCFFQQIWNRLKKYWVFLVLIYKDWRSCQRLMYTTCMLLSLSLAVSSLLSQVHDAWLFSSFFSSNVTEM